MRLRCTALHVHYNIYTNIEIYDAWPLILFSLPLPYSLSLSLALLLVLPVAPIVEYRTLATYNNPQAASSLTTAT